MYDYLSPTSGPVVPGLEQHEVTYAKDQPEYVPLRTLRSKDRDGRVFSRWTPTSEQRKAIAEGADIFLELFTFNEPLQPIRMVVSEAPATDSFRDWFAVTQLGLAVENHRD